MLPPIARSTAPASPVSPRTQEVGTFLAQACVPSGNQTRLENFVSMIKGGFQLGKSLISGPFSIAMFEYQKVYQFTPVPTSFKRWGARCWRGMAYDSVRNAM